MLKRFLFFVSTFVFVPVHLLFAQSTAYVQFFQNSPDPPSLAVDVYINGNKALDNFRYHDATPFLPVPANVQFTVAIADSNSVTATQAFYTRQLTFEADKYYTAIGSGVKDLAKWPGGNPNGRDIAYMLHILENVRTVAADTTSVACVFYQGTFDTEALTVSLRASDQLVENFIYSDFTGYKTIAPQAFLLDARLTADENNRVGTWDFDLRPFNGKAMVVILGGLLQQNPQPSSPFSIQAVGLLPDGTVVTFKRYQTPVALVQIINNSPDSLMRTVDLYMTTEKIADDINFRQSTPMVRVNAQVTGRLDIANKNSNNSGQSFRKIDFGFEEGRTYTIFLSGMIGTSGYAPNPNGKDISMRSFQTNEVRFKSSDTNMVELAVCNLATDLPAVDLELRSGRTIATNLEYQGIQYYQLYAAERSIVDVINSSDPAQIYGSYVADFEALRGRAGILYTSGFGNPKANKNGPDLRLFIVFTNGEVVELPPYIPPTAKLQLLNNSPDPLNAIIDVYVDGAMLYDNLNFRKATPYLSIPADKQVEIAFADGNSTGAGSAFLIKTFNAVNERWYFMALTGVRNTSGYATNPDGKNLGLAAIMKEDVQLTGIQQNIVRTILLPGSGDHAAADFRGQTQGPVFLNAMYGEWTAPADLLPETYLMDITKAGDSTDIYQTYFMNLSGAGGKLIILFTSGFVTPADNKNGPPFGLFGVYDDGRVLPYPKYVAPTARMQFINNIPDPSLTAVDVYIDNTLAADNLAFRHATAFLDFPAEKQVTFSIAVPQSASAAEAFQTFTLSAVNNTAYTSILNGVLNPAQFAANPDAKEISATILRYDSAKMYAQYSYQIEVNSVNGATDVPASVFQIRNGAVFSPQLGFNEQTGYVTQSLLDGMIEIRSVAAPDTAIASFIVDLSSYGGKSGVMFLSGFRSPVDNQNGPELGLFMAFTDGTVIQFDQEPHRFAKIQLVHNSADSRAALVDIWMNNTRIADDLAFRQGTAYIDVPAEEEITVSVAPSTSTSPAGAFATKDLNLPENTSTFILINGVTNTAGFLPNPGSVDISMTMIERTDVRHTSQNPGNAEFLFAGGATDLPTFNFSILDGPVLMGDIAYNGMTDYFPVPVAEQKFDLLMSGVADSILARFDGDITDLKGLAVVVFTSGFYQPALNENGAELGLYAAFPNGSIVPFDRLPVEDNGIESLPLEKGWDLAVSPNPVNASALLRYSTPGMATVDFLVYDRLGRLQLTGRAVTPGSGGHIFPLNVSMLPPGMYIVTMRSGNGVLTRNLSIVR